MWKIIDKWVDNYADTSIDTNKTRKVVGGGE